MWSRDAPMGVGTKVSRIRILRAESSLRIPLNLIKLSKKILEQKKVFMAIFVCDQTRNSEGRKEMENENFLMASREKRKENLLLRTRSVKQRKFVEKLTEK